MLAATPSVAPASSPGDMSSAFPLMPALFVFGEPSGESSVDVGFDVELMIDGANREGAMVELNC